MIQPFENRHEGEDPATFEETHRSSTDFARGLLYALVALSAFLAGAIVGQTTVTSHGRSRIEWPSLSQPKPHPRSLDN
jgi:hypothetical protein